MPLPVMSTDTPAPACNVYTGMACSTNPGSSPPQEFGRGEYTPVKDALVGLISGLSTATGYYWLTEKYQKQVLNDAVSAFRTTISNFQIALENNKQVSNENKSIIRQILNPLTSGTYFLSDLTYSDRLSQLKTIKNQLDIIKTTLAGLLSSENNAMNAAYSNVESASENASRMRIGGEAIVVGASAALAGGLASTFVRPVQDAVTEWIDNLRAREPQTM